MAHTSPKYSGEPTAKALANGLATLGRYGDEYIVHASEGETIVPEEIFEANPKLKDDLFRQMKMMGVDNPNRYVVGNSLNSRNPITGQPEFFFKKIFKAIGKVFKKTLPVLAPIVGNMIAPGIGGIIASGLASKLQGGSWGDAMKSAALTYGVGALGKGITSAFNPQQGGMSGFMEGLGKGLTSPFAAAGALFKSGPANPLAQGIFGGDQYSGSLFPSYTPQVAAPLAAPPPPAGPFKFSPPFTRGAGAATTYRPPFKSAEFPSDGLSFEVAPVAPVAPGRVAERVAERVAAPAPVATATATVHPKSITVDNEKLYHNGTLVRQKIPPGYEAVAPPWYKNLAGKAALPLLTGAAVYALSDDPESPGDAARGADSLGAREAEAYHEWKQLPNKHTTKAYALMDIWFGRPALTGPELRARFGADPLAGFTRPTYAAQGGEVIGRGTGTSDSIPARLSDGEFVMTAEAVRNAGHGNRDLGAARMYDMMNRFERGIA